MRAAHKTAARERRHERIRKKIRGTAVRPRLSVYRSNKHIYAQLIDDRRGHTLAAASSLDVDVDADEVSKTDQARQVGELLADRAADADVTTCVLDRGGNRYAGRIAALAEAARDGGLDF